MSGLDRFTFDIPSKLRFGCGVMDEIQKSSLPGKRLMIVTGGRTIRENGTVDRLVKMVQPKVDSFVLFDDVHANPSLASVMKGSAITYSNEAKIAYGVPENTITKSGVYVRREAARD